MTHFSDLEQSEGARTSVDLREFIKSNDSVLWSQGTGEPRTLTEALVAQRAALGVVNVFLGATYSETLKPEHADHLRFCAIGGIAANGVLSRAGVLDVLPCHLSEVPRLIRDGRFPVDVVMVQVSPLGENGYHSLGLMADYVRPAIDRARIVLAEVNDQVPFTYGDCLVHPDEFDFVVHTSRPPVFIPVRPPTEITKNIGELVGTVIPDGSTLQLGVGGVAPSVALSLEGKRDIGIHTGIIGDWFVDLYQSGALTNAKKPVDKGVSVTGAISGSQRLYNFVHKNPDIELRPVSYTHEPSVLASLDNFFAVNSALEVDLTGQINAETIGGHHVGAIGGQVDFARAAMQSSSGRSIIALASTAKSGEVSRITSRLADGIVTTPRSDADLVVTEYGIADLRGQNLGERARRLIAIAHPRFRTDLLDEVTRTGLC